MMAFHFGVPLKPPNTHGTSHNFHLLKKICYIPLFVLTGISHYWTYFSFLSRGLKKMEDKTSPTRRPFRAPTSRFARLDRLADRLQRLCARLDAVDFKLTAALAAGTPWASLEAEIRGRDARSIRDGSEVVCLICVFILF